VNYSISVTTSSHDAVVAKFPVSFIKRLKVVEVVDDQNLKFGVNDDDMTSVSHQDAKQLSTTVFSFIPSWSSDDNDEKYFEIFGGNAENQSDMRPCTEIDVRDEICYELQLNDKKAHGGNDLISSTTVSVNFKSYENDNTNRKSIQMKVSGIKELCRSSFSTSASMSVIIHDRSTAYSPPVTIKFICLAFNKLESFLPKSLGSNNSSPSHHYRMLVEDLKTSFVLTSSFRLFRVEDDNINLLKLFLRQSSSSSSALFYILFDLFSSINIDVINNKECERKDYISFFLVSLLLTGSPRISVEIKNNSALLKVNDE
jgi:hypothetical protein